MKGIIRDRKGNLKGVYCMVCEGVVGLAGGLFKHKPYCGFHFKQLAKPQKPILNAYRYNLDNKR